MKEVNCIQCGEPAAFPNIVDEPFTCISCQNKPTMPNPESDTPRTDAEVKRDSVFEHDKYIQAEFARQLEQELNNSHQLLEDHRQQYANKELELIEIKSQLSLREVQLKNTLVELTQYKTWADSEIALLKTNLEEAIREHERMAEANKEIVNIRQSVIEWMAKVEKKNEQLDQLRQQLTTLQLDKERLDWYQDYRQGNFKFTLEQSDGFFRSSKVNLRTAIDNARKESK